MRRPRQARSWWTVPAVLALTTAIGLLSALLGDGRWDVLSWVLLGVPVLVCLWFGIVGRSASDEDTRRSVRNSGP